MLFHEPHKIVARYISVVISNFKIEKQKQTFRQSYHNVRVPANRAGFGPSCREKKLSLFSDVRVLGF